MVYCRYCRGALDGLKMVLPAVEFQAGRYPYGWFCEIRCACKPPFWCRVVSCVVSRGDTNISSVYGVYSIVFCSANPPMANMMHFPMNV